MSDVALAAALIRQVEPRRHMPVKEWISATARRLGWHYSRTKAVWYEDARRIDAREMDALRSALIKDARREHENLRARLAGLGAALAAVDPDFHGQTVAWTRELGSGHGSVDRA